MPINVRQEFASVGLASGDGVFAPRPLPSGDLEASRAVGGATMRRFDALGQAIDTTTRALVARGDAVADLGLAATQVGRGLARTFGEIEERKRQALQRHQAATARAQYLIDADGILREAERDAGPAGAGLLERASQRLAERRSELLSKIQDEDLRLAVDADLGLIATRAQIDARSRQAKIESGFLRGELEKRSGAYASQASQFRGPEQVQLLDIAFSDFDDAAAEGTISPIEAERSKAALRSLVLKNTIAVDAERDPRAALNRLRAGEYDHLFAQDAEKVAAAAQIEREIKSQSAAELRQLDSLVEDHLASRQQTRQGVPGLRQRIASLGDQEALARFDEADMLATVYHDTQQAVRWLPPEQAAETVRGTRPAPGMVGFARQQKIHEAAVKAYADRAKALDEDSFAYAAQHPKAQDRAGNIALQQSLTGGAYRFLSKVEASQMVQAFQQAPDDQKALMLSQWAQQAGKHYPVFMRDLVEAKLPPIAQVLMTHADDPAMLPVLSRTFAAERQGKTALEKNLPSGGKAELDQAIFDELAEFRETALAASPDGVAHANLVSEVVRTLALSYAAEGKTPGEAARLAADQLVNGHFAYRGTYRVPSRFDAGRVEAHAQTVLADLSEADPGPVPAELAGLPDAESFWRETWIERTRQTARWVNTLDGEGLVLLTDEGVPVTDRQGNPLAFRFEDAGLTAPVGPTAFQRGLLRQGARTPPVGIGAAP